ncbi:MAG: tRNA lysidine(34) synthetase TilS [Gammaproteobacteria bacterium]
MTTIYIAYSGGVDSHILLDIFAGTPDVKAIHVNHKLHPEADHWAEHCERICQHYSIECIVKTVTIVPKKGESIEALARAARYHVFESLLEAGDMLLTAHHQDDQAETVLLQLLRGAGVKGLSAMPEIASFGQGYLMRPLLEVSREAIVKKAQEKKLEWIEDKSNTQLSFDRNFLRHEIFPKLKTRWPSCAKTFSRSATHCAEAQNVLDAWAKEIMDVHENTLSIEVLNPLSLPQKKAVLRSWIESRGCVLPSEKKLDEIIHHMIDVRWDATPCVTWGEVEVRRYRDKLYILNSKSKEALTNKQLGSKDIRFRQGGETMRLPNRQGRHRLKKLFQEWGVPPWVRDEIPLVFEDGELVEVVGFVSNVSEEDDA